ncbi:MAG: flippase [Candidatus Omnitrophica bacterium]|nr:flippase [Candidatus Omnitrophota bacterium]
MSETPDSSGIVTRGAFLLTLYQLASKAIYLILFILFGNLSNEIYGNFEGLLVLASTFFILSDLGIEAWLTRELSNRPEETTHRLHSLSALKLILTLATGIVLSGWILLTVAPSWDEIAHTQWIVLGCVIYMVALSIQSYVRSISRAHHRFEVEGQMAVADKSFDLFFGGLVFFILPSVLGLMWAFAVAGVVATGYGLFRVGRIQSGLAPIRWPAISVLKEAYPFALSSICIILFYNMDRLMLYQLLEHGDDAVAKYSRAYRIVMGLLLFPQMMSVTLYPVFSKLLNEPEDRVRVGASSLRTLLFIAFPLVLGGCAVAGPLLDLLFPSGDPNAISWSLDKSLGWDASTANITEATVLRILLLSLPFTCCNYLFGPALNALGKEKWNLLSTVITLIVNIVLNLLLIPSYGPAGAAGATALTQFLYSASMYFFLRRSEGSWFRGFAVWRFLVLAIGMGILLVLVDDLPVYFSIPVGGLTYLAAVWYLGGWPDGLRNLLPGRFRQLEP